MQKEISPFDCHVFACTNDRHRAGGAASAYLPPDDLKLHILEK
jgi:hypothetical protein